MCEDGTDHGRYSQLVFDADGKRTTRSISAERAAVLRAEVEECQHQRRLTSTLTAVRKQLSEARFASEGSSA